MESWAGASRATARVRVQLLGRFRVERDGVAIPPSAWVRRRAVDLLFLLALAPGHGMRRERVADLLWPEKDPESGANNVHRALHDLRKAIGDDAVLISKGVVRLADDVWIDAAAFDAAARSADPDVLSAALDGYPGDLAVDEASFDASEHRDRLRQSYLDSTVRVARAEWVTNRAAAIARLRRAVELDPTAEETQRLLMRYLAEAGRKSDAIRQYEMCRAALRDALDAEPGVETESLYTAILEGRIDQPRSSLHGWARAARRLLGATALAPLRGRAVELAALTSAIDDGAAIALLLGESGIGKTRLAVEAARIAGERGAVVLSGASLESDAATPFAPLVDAWSDHLRSAGLPPEDNPFLTFVPSPEGRPQEDKIRLYEAVSRSLDSIAGSRPILFVIDDLHFADESTLGLLHFLARSARTRDLTIMATCSEEGVAANPRVATLIAALYRERLGRRTVVPPLDDEASRQLVEDRVGPERAAAVSAEILHRAEGNPFFIEEISIGYAEGNADAIPSDLRALLRTRIERLGGDVSALLNAAAVMGTTFDFTTVASASGLPTASALAALETAIAARLVEQTDDAYRFRHTLLPESISVALVRERRISLHGAVARAMERNPMFCSERAADIAHHYREGAQIDKAIPFLVSAGQKAAMRVGFGEAVALFEQALIAMDQLGVPHCQERFQLMLAIGQMRVALGDLTAAVDGLDEACRMCREGDGWRPSCGDRAQARRWAALALITNGDLEEADQRLAIALEEAADGGQCELPDLLYHVAQVRWHEGDYREAFRVAERCLAAAEETGNVDAVARGYEILSLACHSLGEWRDGVSFEEKRQSLIGAAVDVGQAFDVHL